jgi:GMP synthase PP-ATPase subunit
MLEVQGDRVGALAAYRAGLAIAERLARADPDNQVWQVDVIVPNAKLAGMNDDAPRRWRLIVERLRALQVADKLTAQQATWLPEAEAELAKLGGR